MTSKNTLFQYSDDKMKEVETVGRTDICDFIKEPLSSGWDDSIIDDGIVDQYQITSRLLPGEYIRIVIEYRP